MDNCFWELNVPSFLYIPILALLPLYLVSGCDKVRKSKSHETADNPAAAEQAEKIETKFGPGITWAEYSLANGPIELVVSSPGAGIILTAPEAFAGIKFAIRPSSESASHTVSIKSGPDIANYLPAGLFKIGPTLHKASPGLEISVSDIPAGIHHELLPEMEIVAFPAGIAPDSPLVTDTKNGVLLQYSFADNVSDITTIPDEMQSEEIVYDEMVMTQWYWLAFGNSANSPINERMLLGKKTFIQASYYEVKPNLYNCKEHDLAMPQCALVSLGSYFLPEYSVPGFNSFLKGVPGLALLIELLTTGALSEVSLARPVWSDSSDDSQQVTTSHVQTKNLRYCFVILDDDKKPPFESVTAAMVFDAAAMVMLPNEAVKKPLAAKFQCLLADEDRLVESDWSDEVTPPN